VAGVGNLRVADACVMPNVLNGNTNAASIMIREKGVVGAFEQVLG